MALTPYVALLRGVNVGGRGKVAMADLRAMLAELGFADPQSLVQSGNLVFGADVRGAALEGVLEAECERRFGLTTEVIVRDRNAWRAIVAANPFPEFAKDDPSHLVVMALKDAPGDDKVDAVRAAIVGREQAHLNGRELYLTYPDNIGDSKLTGAVIERRLGVRGTARNWNTVTKLAAMLEARG